MLPLRVLGDRVLIQPDRLDNAPEQLASGVVLAKTLAAAVTGEDATTSVCRGTVIAVGKPKHPLHREAEGLARSMDAYAAVTASDVAKEQFHDTATMLRDLTRREPCCAVGDDVLFSHDAGQQITLDNETYVLMREDELLAVVTPELETV